MNNIIYKGPFKNHIKNYIELKQAIGYKYTTNAENLWRFDRFTLEKHPKAATFTKEIVLEWCKKRTYEKQANQNRRASDMREFGKYLDSIGIKTYILPKGFFSKSKHYIPHIYTIDELTRFFAETNKCKYCYECPHRHHIMPVIFRMIYMCGLRASEARLLKVADVDLENGVLVINQSKKDNSRLVPMSADLTKLCRDFTKKVHVYSLPESYYFPAFNDKPMKLGNLYKNFRKFLWRAKISHGGRGSGPRIHDFRHTYAVHCFKKWAEQGKDLTVYLPILKTYMGHDSFYETAYYLHLTADVFPHITLKMEDKYSEIIPELKGEFYEAN